MGRKSKVMAKKRLDKFYRLAKDEGYKSRAAFKLIQINREYNFLGNCKCLIDLCAAPGGWTQVASKYMPLSSQIIAVDICKMKKFPGVVCITEDITTQKCKFEIKKHLHGYDVDAIIHDGAPNVTGAWSKDAYGQCSLTLSALKLATQFLKCGGLFVTKVFRSADYNSLLWVIQQLFENVTSFKPIASRQSSAEIYLICQNYLAPKKIDSRLLDPKFVFREIEEKKESISVMQRKKKKKIKPSRTGYDQDGLLYKTKSILDFIQSETPEVMLGEYNAFVFETEEDEQEAKDKIQLILEHKVTDQEVHALLNDLRLLAKSDFRRLLKWRLKIRKYFDALLGTEEEEEEEEEKQNELYTQQELENLEDEKLEADVREMFDAKKREKRKQKRKIRQEKIKRTRLMLMGGIKPDDVWEIGAQEQQGEGLFSLSKFANAEQLNNFLDTKNTVLLPRKAKSKPLITFKYKFDDSDEELEVEGERLDALYQRYKKKHGLRTIKEKRKLIKDGIGLQSDDDFSDMDADSEDNENDDEAQHKINDDAAKKAKMDIDANEDGGGLVVDDKDFILKQDSKMTKATRWFADNIFDDIEVNEKLDEKEIEQEFGSVLNGNQTKVDNDGDFEIVSGSKQRTNTNKTDAKSSTNEDKDDFKYKDLPEILKLPYKVRMKMKKMNRDHRRRLKREEEKRKERDCLFEEVPETLDNDSSDSEAIAEVQALGHKMLKKKTRMEMIDASYNRYAFDDEDVQIPEWFKDDENGNYTVNLPVTKEEVREYKERLKAINARPIKKIAEAKARKKLKAQRIWNKIKRRATGIADNSDLSERTKIKQIERLYGKLGRKKNKRVYMIATSTGRKARPADGKKPPKNATKVYVDKRLKADKLGTVHSNKRKLIGKIKKSSRRQMNRKNKRRKR